MILVADSGSTKTNWNAVFNGEQRVFQTTGINPFFLNSQEIVVELEKNIPKNIHEKVKRLFFYGAGIVNNEKSNEVKQALKQVFKNAEIEVQNDLLGAARATLKKNSGIVCILGTGSNSGYYNGTEISEHVPPLGFILGDEGSGAVLGKKLVSDYLKGIMPENLAKKFAAVYQIKYDEFLKSVYQTKKPNKFLAGFAPFLSENMNEQYCTNLVENAFDEFIIRNIERYTNYESVSINFAGSVANAFQNQLKKVLKEKKLTIGQIVKEPLAGLTGFHLEHLK